VTSVAAWDEELLQFTSGWVRREGQTVVAADRSFHRPYNRVSFVLQLLQTVSETPPPKPSNPLQRNPSSVPPKPTASRSERHFCVKILGNLGTQAPLKRVLEPVSYIEPQRDFAWAAVFFPGGGAPVDGIGLPGMVAFMMLVPLFLDPASVEKPRSKLL